MAFTKEDLLYEYSWKSGTDTSLYTGEPTRRFFDRTNGFQVLFIIGLFIGPDPDPNSTATGQKIEECIKNWLPAEVKSEVSVLKWFNEMGISTPQQILHGTR